MPTGILGIRDINPNMWTTSASNPTRGGVFVNFARATEPTVRPNNDALAEGDMYYNTTSDTWNVYTGAAWSTLSSLSGAVDLDTAYGNGQSIAIDAGALTLNDATTGALNTFTVNKTGTGSGNLIDVNTTAAWTGDALNITMTTAGTTAQALVITGQAAVRATNPLIAIDEAGTGAVPTVDILGSAATTGALLRVRSSAAVAPVANTDGMITLDTTSSANATQGLLIYNNTAGHTGALLRILDAGATGAGTSLSIGYSTTFTGDAINIAMTNAGTAAQALVITGQAAARITNALVQIDEAGTGALPTFDVLGSAATTGPLVRVRASAAVAQVADTNGMVTIDTTSSANATQGLLLYNNTAGHTGALLRIVDAAATGAGQSIGIAYSTTFTGDAINIAMTNAGAGAQALVVTGHTAATSNLLEVTHNGTGGGNALALIAGSTMSGDLLDLAATGAITGDFMAVTMTNAGNGADGITMTGSPVGRTGVMVGITDAQTTGSGATISVTKSGALAVGDVFNIDLTSTGAGPVFDINLSAAYTGIVFDIDGSVGIHTGNVIDFATTQAYTGIFENVVMTNSGVGAQALVVVGQAGAATSSLCSITANGTGNSHHALDLVAGGALSATDGALLDLSATAAIAGDFVLLTMTNAADGADGIVLTGSPTGRTGNMMSFADAQTTGSGATLALTKSGALAVGDVIDITCSNTGAGAVFDIDLTAAYTGIVFDIDGTVGVHTGDIFNFNTTQAYAGDVFDITLTNCGAGVQALVITGSATTRTAHLIEIAEVGTPSGDTINITHGGATTGDAIHCDQANAVAGRALNLDGSGVRTVNLIDIDTTGADTASCIAVDTTAVGANGVAGAATLTGTGDLVAGADLLRVISTGSPSGTSNVIAAEQSTGAGTAWSTAGNISSQSSGPAAIYASATGTNVEGIWVDAGNVYIDETLYRYHIRTTATTGSVTLVDGDSGVFITNRGAVGAVIITLPAVSSTGFHCWVAVLADQNVTIASAAGDDICIMNDAAADSVAFSTAGQRIGQMAYVVSDGTNWFIHASGTIPGGTSTITTAT